MYVVTYALVRMRERRRLDRLGPISKGGVGVSLEGKFALITGSSRGIGRGIALKLAEQGAKVGVNHYQNEAAADDTLAKIRERGSDGFVIQGDVRRPQDISRMFKRVQEEFGALDIFVSNARTEVPTFYRTP